MKRSTLLLAPLAAAITLGATLALAGSSQSPFSGAWSGTYDNLTVGDGGTIEFGITDQGVLSGGFVNTTLGIAGKLRGNVKDDGSLKVTGKDAAFPALHFQGTMSIAGGHLLIDCIRTNDNSHIVCDLTQ